MSEYSHCQLSKEKAENVDLGRKTQLGDVDSSFSPSLRFQVVKTCSREIPAVGMSWPLLPGDRLSTSNLPRLDLGLVGSKNSLAQQQYPLDCTSPVLNFQSSLTQNCSLVSDMLQGIKARACARPRMKLQRGKQ